MGQTNKFCKQVITQNPANLQRYSTALAPYCLDALFMLFMLDAMRRILQNPLVIADDEPSSPALM